MPRADTPSLDKFECVRVSLLDAIKAATYVKATQIPNIVEDVSTELVEHLAQYADDVLTSLFTGIADSDSIRALEDCVPHPAIFFAPSCESSWYLS